MSAINERRMSARPYQADCPFSLEVIPCSLTTCDGCHIRDKYNREMDKRDADKLRGLRAEQANGSADWRG